ncbi:MAG: 30S ribosomal protein S12 methylthiotransferase RimO [Bacteroidales bacterium]|nr:30S ribosomal protein S12 methylthiotransferase RimO [Bacteroidales bacterium]
MKINIITLGCSKNLVDSEVLGTHLHKFKNKIIFDGEIDSGKIAIVNTCGFINDAKEESIETIMNLVQAKQEKSIEKIYVMGCLSERYKKDLISEIPEVDGFFGVNDLPEILSSLNADSKNILHGERLISTPSHYAFLKIAEGCNRQCAFCAIPMIRGNHISQPVENIVAEADYLTKNGVKELMLISQDLSYYGKDLYGEYHLRKLLDELVKVEKLEWLRLHYLYPTDFLEPVLDLMAQNPKICSYIDIPFQHISSKILKSMKRGHSEKSVRDLVDLFRKKVPDVALRTTMIVGYPGETDEDFRKLVDFVQQADFDRLGVFTYSEEEGTSAAKFKDDVSAELKQERLDEIMEIQSSISLKKNQEKIGKIFKVLIDREEQDYFVGRTEFDSPEVDNEVLIPKTKKLKTGLFYNVKINSAEEFDLIGEVE